MLSKGAPSYSLAVWRRLRAYHLSLNPWCVYCAKGRCEHKRKAKLPRTAKLPSTGAVFLYYCLVAATVVDHIVPHKGSWSLFLDKNNLQSLCKRCHDTLKRLEDYASAVDADGYPIEEPQNGS